jgi:hypothetical protein
LVPDFITMLSTPPPVRPNSTELAFVRILNSLEGVGWGCDGDKGQGECAKYGIGNSVDHDFQGHWPAAIDGEAGGTVEAVAEIAVLIPPKLVNRSMQ